MSSVFHPNTLSSCYWNTKVHKPIKNSPKCKSLEEIYQENHCTKQEPTHHTEHASAATKKKEQHKRHHSLNAGRGWRGFPKSIPNPSSIHLWIGY